MDGVLKEIMQQSEGEAKGDVMMTMTWIKNKQPTDTVVYKTREHRRYLLFFILPSIQT
jgi:hypothetical protein